MMAEKRPDPGEEEAEAFEAVFVEEELILSMDMFICSLLGATVARRIRR